MTTVLAVDSSSKYPSIAIGQNKRILSKYNFSNSTDLSSVLIPSLDMVLKNLNLQLEDIDLIGLTKGPGIFTGIRVGLSTIKGLMAYSEKPIVTIYSTTAIAYKCNCSNRRVIPLIDAKRGEVYVASISSVSHQPEPKPSLIKISELKDFVGDVEDPVFTGSGAEVHQQYLKSDFPESSIQISSPWLGEAVALMTENFYEAGFFTKDITDITPCYIRKSDAEANFKR